MPSQCVEQLQVCDALEAGEALSALFPCGHPHNALLRSVPILRRLKTLLLRSVPILRRRKTLLRPSMPSLRRLETSRLPSMPRIPLKLEQLQVRYAAGGRDAQGGLQ